MKLENFEILSPIELRGEGLVWELHNFANFDGLELSVRNNSVFLTWSAPAARNPWGCLENKFSGMKLHFKDLSFLGVGERSEGMPLSEDTCLSTVLKVDPAVENVNPYLRAVLTETDAFRLMFRFQSGRAIEIGSSTVELITVV